MATVEIRVLLSLKRLKVVRDHMPRPRWSSWDSWGDSARRQQRLDDRRFPGQDLRHKLKASAPSFVHARRSRKVRPGMTSGSSRESGGWRYLPVEDVTVSLPFPVCLLLPDDDVFAGIQNSAVPRTGFNTTGLKRPVAAFVYFSRLDANTVAALPDNASPGISNVIPAL
jgi:hypothetical protein